MHALQRYRAPQLLRLHRSKQCNLLYFRIRSNRDISIHQSHRLRASSTDASTASAQDETASTSSAVITGDGRIAEVDRIVGVRIIVDDDGNARAEYLVKWKDEHPATWEQQSDIADNVLRDFENTWWTAARAGDEETIRQLLEGGGKVLARAVNEEGRSALHFAAALGKVGATRMLCEAGAVVDAQDKDGYTALHMATGYLHTATMKVLLEFGADPEVEDRNGRSPLGLADNIRKGMPNVPELLSRRMALDNCSAMLTDVLFEDLEPAAILDVREEEGSEKEYLVRWPDDADDTWVRDTWLPRGYHIRVPREWIRV